MGRNLPASDCRSPHEVDGRAMWHAAFLSGVSLGALSGFRLSAGHVWEVQRAGQSAERGSADKRPSCCAAEAVVQSFDVADRHGEDFGA